MNAPYAETVRCIDAADLPAPTVKLAMRLLAAANPQIGMLRLTWEDFLDLAGCENRNAARRHLTRLVQAGAIHYETNAYVRIDFIAWADCAPPAARPHAEMRASAPPTARADEPADEPDAPPAARPRAEMRTSAPPTARADAPTYTHASAPGRLGKVRLGPNPDHDLDQTLPNPPTPHTDQAWAYDLLTDPDVGVLPGKANACLGLLSLDGIVRRVAAWWQDHHYAQNGKRVGVGALVHRLTNPDKSHPGPISPEFLASPLYRRHYGRLAELDDPPEWFWALPAPPAEQYIELADGSRVRLEGGGR